jgi:hypothetical protein
MVYGLPGAPFDYSAKGIMVDYISEKPLWRTQQGGRDMKSMPTRDTTGKCEGECRNRVFEGEIERQKSINTQPYSSPNPNTPDWVKNRTDQPAVWGGRV